MSPEHFIDRGAVVCSLENNLSQIGLFHFISIPPPPQPPKDKIILNVTTPQDTVMTIAPLQTSYIADI